MKTHVFLLLTVLVAVTLLGSSALARRGEQPREIADDFQEVRFAPDKHEGEEVIWGGQVGGVVRIDGGVEMIVSEIPVSRLGEPNSGKYSRGRYIGLSTDTSLADRFSTGDYVIVTGIVMGSETRALGRDDYTYPVLKLREAHPCEQERDYGVVRMGDDRGTVEISGPFCVDPETGEKHKPSEHHRYD